MFRNLTHVVGVLAIELLAAGAFLALWSMRIQSERDLRPAVAVNAPFQFGVQPWTMKRTAPLYYWSSGGGESPAPAMAQNGGF